MLWTRPTRLLASACAVAVLCNSSLLSAQTPPRTAGDTLRLSLGDAVGIAMRQSDEVALASAQIAVASAQFGVARASSLPQLRFSGSYLRVYESARGQAVGSVFNQPNTYTANLNLSQAVFQGGRLVNGIRAANRALEAVYYDERELRSAVTIQVQRTYLQALYANRIVELQERNLALASSRLEQVEQFEKAGRAARYDVLRSRVERANIEPLTIQARSDRALALLDLRRVLNVGVDQPIVLTTRIDSSSAIALLAALDDSTALPDRASVRAAEAAFAARQFGIAIARADFYPTVTAFFQSGYQAFPLTGLPRGGGALTEQACPVGSVAGRTCQNGGYFSDRQAGLNVSVPIFDGFRVKSNLDLAQAQAHLAEVQLRQTREVVSVDVAKARAELSRARAVFSARRQNSAEADEAFRLATLRFSRGLSTQLEVSDAQVALLTAQGTEARATYDLYLAAADLARALGRPIPVPPASLPASR